MNVGMIACLTLGIFFLIFSICFAILKEKEQSLLVDSTHFPKLKGKNMIKKE